MAKLKLQVQVSIDGFIAGPDGEMDWMQWNWDDKLKEYVGKLTDPVQLILLGRKMSEGFIPHWKKTVDEKGLSSMFYASTQNELFCNPVAPGIFSIKSMEDSVWKWTLQSPLIKKNAAGKFDYKYSDLGFYIMKRLAEKQLNQPLDEFMEQHFYGPLGMNNT
ncbi:MAG: hypothetical protein EOP54_28250, partial [Sphingobacteriales bacterium]